FFFYLAVCLLSLSSFPTRRSSDLQLIFGFATFAIAFLVRPIGGVFFGRLGDKMGRKSILAITLIMMAAATLSIGNGQNTFPPHLDRKSTRLNSSHVSISYAVFCLK